MENTFLVFHIMFASICSILSEFLLTKSTSKIELVFNLLYFMNSNQRVVEFFCYIFPNDSEIRPNSVSSMEGMN